MKAIHRSQSLWPARLLFFFMYAGIGIFFLFLNVYYREIGLSGTQIGLLGTLGPLVGILSAVIWGMLNDRFGKPRLLFMLTIPGVMLCTIALSQTRSYGFILLIALLYGLFNSPISPLVDSVTLYLLGNKKENYGMIRLWGTLAYVIFSAGAGFLFARLGFGMMFAGYIITLSCLLITSQFLPDQSIPSQQKTSLWAGFKTMVGNPRWLLFAICVFLTNTSLYSLMAFGGVMIKEMGGSESLIGLSWSIPAIAEIGLMYIAARLLKRGGAFTFLVVAMFGYALQLFLIGIMPKPEWFLWINLATKAITYVPFWLGAVAYANQLAPAHLKATSQGLLNSLMSFASLTSALVSGWMFDALGPGKMFMAFAGVSALGGVLFLLGQILMKPKSTSMAGESTA